MPKADAIIQAYNQKSNDLLVLEKKRQDLLLSNSTIQSAMAKSVKNIVGMADVRLQSIPGRNLKSIRRLHHNDIVDKPQQSTTSTVYDRLHSLDGYTVARMKKHLNENAISGDYIGDPSKAMKLLQSMSHVDLNTPKRSQDFGSTVQFRLSLRPNLNY